MADRSSNSTQTTQPEPTPEEKAAAEAAAAAAAAEEARQREESARQFQERFANVDPALQQVMAQAGSSARERRGLQGG